MQVLRDDSPAAARNIALAGHYGSGKSSVILGVQEGLDRAEMGWVNLSLSSLGFDDSRRARVQEDGSVPPLTNLIQKEIVKQLLYRKAPVEMPASRYQRIDSFHSGRAAAWAAVVGVTFVLLAAVLGLVARIRTVAPQSWLSWNEQLPWLALLGVGAFVGVVWFMGLKSFQSGLRVQSLSAGGAAVQVSAKENSYFDEYLDEIVYFFQRTKTRVAIFEDLDRFKDPHIFETLRELNTLLNNAEQIRMRPIRFVYAVRDSIFEDLSRATSDDAPSNGGSSAASLETRPSANRTKFFDLVVPMVPFLTHRSARDLIFREFADTEEPPSSELLNLVGPHLTDMRLIRNIRNEFEVYRPSILRQDGLKGLSADRLLAILVYKNLHLDDFEAVRLGTSAIDRAYASYRALVQHQLTYQAKLDKAALDRLQSDQAWTGRAADAGRRLSAVVNVVARLSGRPGAFHVEHQGKRFELDALGSPELWRALSEDAGPLTVANPTYGVRSTLSSDELRVLMSQSLDLKPASQADEARLRRQSRTARATRDFVMYASMADLLGRTDLTMPGEDGEVSLADLVQAEVSPLAYDLLAKGYIDENFTLYCSDFHAVAISVTAMNFILHCVHQNKADYHFRFDGADSVDAVRAEEGDRFLHGNSAFNLAVFDHYLETEPSALTPALSRLVIAKDPHTGFLETYLADGARPAALVELLMPRWPDAFVRIGACDTIDAEAKRALLDTALRHATDDMDYASDESVTTRLTRDYPHIAAFTEDPAASPDHLAALAERLGATFPSLEQLGPDQRRAIADAGLFPVTRDNLCTALQAEAPPALDRIRDRSPKIYAHVLNQLPAYLSTLHDTEHTVADPNTFIDILNEVHAAAPAALEAVADAAAPQCLVATLDDVDEAARLGVAAARRVQPSAHNLHLLMAGSSEIAPEVVRWLANVDLEDPSSVADAVRDEMSIRIANTAGLDAAQRARLIGQLDPPNYLPVDSLNETGAGALPQLVAAGHVEDSAETYQRIADRPYREREALLLSSAALSTYVAQLPLSASDLTQIFQNPSVTLAVKQTLAADPQHLSARIDPASAAAIAGWARTGQGLSAQTLAVVAEHGAKPDAVLDLLVPLLPSIDQETLDRILRAIGDRYEALTRTGHHRPKLDRLDGVEELLEALKARGRVSSWRNRLRGGIEVHMRRDG